MEKPVRILLVEDEVVTAMSLKMELEKAGFEVCDQVTTGENAIMSAEQNTPDIILMDIRLAGKINGVEAAEKIKLTSEIPIIFLTGYEDRDTMERAKKINPLAYLIKPVGIGEIKAIIHTVFKYGLKE
jgi:two-component system, response regulator PdtaR